MRSHVMAPSPAVTPRDPPRREEVRLPQLLDGLFADHLILREDWSQLPPATQEKLARCNDLPTLLDWLEANRLLTAYQAERIKAGRTHGLVLGHYRVLSRLGAGGMGVVFKAEHVLLRRLAAVKVLDLPEDDTDTRPLQRFFSEIRTLGTLEHPNVVAPMDAGQVAPPRQGDPILHYLAMEFVEGPDLEKMVKDHGPLAVPVACDLIRQAAAGLSAAHAKQLVHRDIKPSNIKVRPLADGTAGDAPKYHVKLLDFGLAQDFRRRMTEPGVLLGTLDYIAPEQAQNAHAADVRADIYGLGGVLYWCLTGQVPFPARGPAPQEIVRRMTAPPPSARAVRPEVPAELDAVLARMLAPRPDQRYATPDAVIRGLLPFLGTSGAAARSVGDSSGVDEAIRWSGGTRPRVLLVDDDSTIRAFCRLALRSLEADIEEADSGDTALLLLRNREYDMLVLDVHLPGLSGADVLRRIRSEPAFANLRVLLLSGMAPPDDLARLLVAGADDYLAKPFTATQFEGRVQAALRLKTALDRSEQLTRHLQAVSIDLERDLTARDCDLTQARSAMVLALAQVLGHRSTETEAHLIRVQHYSRLLAEAAAGVRPFNVQIDANFVLDLECCAPLHDIGIVALPDHILLKPGKLDGEERVVMQSHTTIGADIIQKVLKKYGTAVHFLKTAVDLARSHHERYDGLGYPDRLCGDAIPLVARLLSIGDVYDALRSRRSHRPGLPHAAAVQVLTDGSPGQFDPALIEVFRTVAPQFDAFYRQYPD
jgi:response regulator RpfG family c-di-GMP phosphodiesterase/serine/threonine protein kinase